VLICNKIQYYTLILLLFCIVINGFADDNLYLILQNRN